MNLSTRALVGGLLVMIGAFGVSSAGCGQAVATCSSVCPEACGGAACPHSPEDPEGVFCSSGCPALEASCSASGHSAELQLYLTCLGNAGGYQAGKSVCASIASLVSTECTGSGTGLGGEPDAGTGVRTGTGSGSGVDEICVTLGPCCSSLPEPGAAQCTQAVATNNQPECIAFLQDVGGGFCEGPGFGSCTAGAACVTGDACGSTGSGCNESCTCVAGVMACTGHCP